MELKLIVWLKSYHHHQPSIQALHPLRSTTPHHDTTPCVLTVDFSGRKPSNIDIITDI